MHIGQKKYIVIFSTIIFLMLMPTINAFANVEDHTLTSEENITESGFRYDVLEDGTIEIKSYRGNSLEVIIPDTIDGKNVTSIKDYAFSSDEVKIISIPESIIEIKDYAFSECNELEEVIFRNPGLQKIGERAFSGCSMLSTIILPETLVSIGECAFVMTPCLTRINIPSNITTLDRGTFYNSGITKIIFDDGVSFIGEGMFESCDNLKKVTIPDTVKEICSSAFAQCSNLTSIDIPKSVKKIASDAFYGTDLKTIGCYEDSYAYDYAMESKIKVKLLGPHFSKQEVTIYKSNKKELKIVNGESIKGWKSSNTKVVKVTKAGEITAVKKGTATISVTVDGTKITCKITVKDISINKKKATITAGKTIQLKVNGAVGNPSWTTSNSKIATVSKKGVVTGKSSGSATITAKINGHKYTSKITVKSNSITLFDVSDYCQMNELTICINKVSYSGNSMIVEGYVVNNTSSRVTKLLNVNITVMNSNSVIAQQSYKEYEVNMSPMSNQKCKFTINSKNVMVKNLELSKSDISATADGQYIYFR